MSWRPERVRQHGKDEAVRKDWARRLSRALELNFLLSLSLSLSINLSISLCLPFNLHFYFVSLLG